MQKALSELATISEAELVELDRYPLLVTHNGEPRLVAQSLDSFEKMVRRLRELEATTKRPIPELRGKLILLPSRQLPTR